MSAYLEAEYAFTDRFSVTAALPYVFAKYTDPKPASQPHSIPSRGHVPLLAIGVAGLRFYARYNLIGGTYRAFALTPSVSVGVPSQNYNFRGVRIH